MGVLAMLGVPPEGAEQIPLHVQSRMVDAAEVARPEVAAFLQACKRRTPAEVHAPPPTMTGSALREALHGTPFELPPLEG